MSFASMYQIPSLVMPLLLAALTARGAAGPVVQARMQEHEEKEQDDLALLQVGRGAMARDGHAGTKMISWSRRGAHQAARHAYPDPNPFEDMPQVPYPELMPPGLNYSQPQGSGCGKPHSRMELLDELEAPAVHYNLPATADNAGWNGFCQVEWTLCPDAVANKDYNYYARGLGMEWVNIAGPVDKWYCYFNGFLKPEIAQIRNNFTALQVKGEELCSTTFADERYMMHNVTLAGGPEIMMETAIKKSMSEGPVQGTKALADHAGLDAETAAIGAAWNCAMGDLGCDLAYCNYFYCDLADGSVGVADQCEGWDKRSGVPA
jgi:hypothetical protein